MNCDVIMRRQALMVCCLRTVATFLLGFSIGAIFNLLLTSFLQLPTFNSVSSLNITWEAWQQQDVLQGRAETGRIREENQHISLSLAHQGEFMEGAPRVLCFVLVGPSTHHLAIHVKNTWGQRCDRLVFYSTQEDLNLNPEVLNVPEGYGRLWGKTKAALQHLHRQYPHYDWYLKADDDTFIIVENLRYFLRYLDPDLPVYYGVKFRKFVKQGYMSGGGGYVLSREALRRFVTEALKIEDQSKCATRSNKGAEDMELGKCLESVGVAAGDSLDEVGRSRFFSHSPSKLFFQQPILNRLHWYWRYIWHPHPVGPDCCSRHVISFHEIDPRMMWVLETLLYRLDIHRELQPSNLNTSTSTQPPPPSSTSHTHSNPIHTNYTNNAKLSNLTQALDSNPD